MAPSATYHFRGRFLFAEVNAFKDIFTEASSKA